MMTWVTMAVDVLALSIIWWTAFAGLHGGSEVRTWRGAFLTSSLLALMVCAFCGIFAVVMKATTLDFWMRGGLYSVACVSLWLYDHRFGIRRQSCLLRTWARGLIRHTPKRTTR